MRNTIIAPGEHYHIVNRGNNKQLIFLDDRDRSRFLFLILYFQSPTVLNNIPYYISHFIKHSVFNISKSTKDEIIENRYVELINFALMPNHFHLTVQELKENGIARYMQRVLNGYTKYFNTK
ncbi:MAG: transposase, partial [Candidatus Niyogibacteria bacterium]|nr:transposase [Candidatus Niyogibacteria bacterium]